MTENGLTSWATAPMYRAWSPAWLALILIVSASIESRAQTQEPAREPGDTLKIYAVNVVKTPPLEKQFNGFGIYLGKGAVITAAHVVGNFPNLTHPRVLVAGLDLPAKIEKQGSLEKTDLAVLSIDEAQLPVSLKLRQNPLCKGALIVGTNVVVVYPDKVVRSRVISPLSVAPRYQRRFNSLISEEQGSGSGVFDAERNCLLGIISMKVQKFSYRKQYGRLVATPAGYAGYFVPATAIAEFIPPEYRF